MNEFINLDDVVSNPEFASSTPDEKDNIINELFKTYQPIAERSDGDAELLFNTKLNLQREIAKERIGKSVLEMLEPEARNEQNAEALYKHFVHYWNDTDQLKKSPSKVRPIHYGILSDDEVFQLTDQLKRGGQIPVLLPSEMDKLRVRLAEESEAAGESPDFNPIADSFTQLAIQDTFKGDELQKGATAERDEDFESKGKLVFDAMFKLSNVSALDQVTKWTSVTGMVDPKSKQDVIFPSSSSTNPDAVFAIRRKPSPNSNTWQIRTSGMADKNELPIEVNFDRELDMHDPSDTKLFNDSVADAIRANYSKFSDERGELNTGGSLQDFTDSWMDMALSNSKRDVMQNLFGVEDRGFFGNLWSDVKGKVAPAAPSILSATAMTADWMAGHVSNTFQMGDIYDDEKYNVLRPIAKTFSQLTDKMRRTQAPTEEDLKLPNGWNWDGSQVMGKTMDFAKIAAELFATRGKPIEGIGLMSAEASQGTFSELYQEGLDAGLDDDEAYRRASTGGIVEGLVNGTLMYFSGKAMINNRLASDSIRNIIRKGLGGYSERAAVRGLTEFAAAVPGDVGLNLGLGAAMKINHAIITDLAQDGVVDESGKPIREFLGEDGLQNLREQLTHFGDDVFFGLGFAGISAARSRGDMYSTSYRQPKRGMGDIRNRQFAYDDSPVWDAVKPPEKYRPLKWGDNKWSLFLRTEKGNTTQLHFDSEESARSVGTTLQKIEAHTERHRRMEANGETIPIEEKAELRSAIDAFNKATTSQLDYQSGQVSSERYLSAHESFTEAANAILEYANKFVVGGKESISSQRTKMVNQLVDHRVDRSRDWNKERQSFLDNFKRQFPAQSTERTAKIDDALAKLESEMSEMDNNSREFRKAQADYAQLVEIRAKSLQGIKPTDSARAEAAADAWIESQKRAERENFRESAEKQADRVFGIRAEIAENPLNEELQMFAKRRQEGDLLSQEELNRELELLAIRRQNIAEFEGQQASFDVNVPEGSAELTSAVNNRFVVDTKEVPWGDGTKRIYEVRFMEPGEAPPTGRARESAEAIQEGQFLSADEAKTQTAKNKVSQLEKAITKTTPIFDENLNKVGEKIESDLGVATNLGGEKSAKESADVFEETHRQLTEPQQNDLLRGSLLRSPKAADILSSLVEGENRDVKRSEAQAAIDQIDAELELVNNLPGPERKFLQTNLRNMRRELTKLRDTRGKRKSPVENAVEAHVEQEVASPAPEGKPVAEVITEQVVGETGTKPKDVKSAISSIPNESVTEKAKSKSRSVSRQSRSRSAPATEVGPDGLVRPKGKPLAEGRLTPQETVAAENGGTESAVETIILNKNKGEMDRGRKIGEPKEEGGFTIQQYENGKLITSIRSGNERWVPNTDAAKPKTAEAPKPDAKAAAPKPEAKPPEAAEKPESVAEEKPKVILREGETVVKLPQGDGTFKDAVWKNNKFVRWADEAPAPEQGKPAPKEGTENLAKAGEKAGQLTEPKAEAEWSQATKDAVAKQRSSKLPVGLTEANKQRQYTEADRKAIAEDLGVDTTDPVRLARFIHDKFRPGKGVEARTGSEGAEASAQKGDIVSEPTGVEKLQDMPDGTTKYKVGNEIVFVAKGVDPVKAIEAGLAEDVFPAGKRVSKPEKADTVQEPAKPLNPKAKGKVSKSRSKKGETIIFSELADMAINGIKAGWNYAKFVAEAIKKFGDNFREAIRDAWVHVSSSFAEEVSQREFPKYKEGTPQKPARPLVDTPSLDAALDFELNTTPEQKAYVAEVTRQDRNAVRSGQLTDANLEKLRKDVERTNKNIGALSWTNLFRPMWKALKDIHPLLGDATNAAEFAQLKIYKDFHERLDPLFDGLKKLKKAERQKFFLLEFTGDKSGMDAFMSNKPSLKAAWNDWTIHRQYIYDVSQANGLKYGFIDDYFPHHVKDYRGLMVELSGDINHTAFDAAISAAQAKKAARGSGTILTEQEIADVTGSFLKKSFSARGGYGPSTRGRKIKSDDAAFVNKIMKHYETDPHISLLGYIERMARDISTARYFGADAVSQFKAGYVDPFQAIPKSSVIGNILWELKTKGEITGPQLNDATSLIKSKLLYQMSPAFIRGLRSGNVMLALHGPNMLNQLTSGIVSVYNNGFRNSLMAPTKFLKKYRDGVTMKDLGLDSSLSIHTGETYLRMVNDFFWKWGGGKLFDVLEGNTSLNSRLLKLQKMSREKRMEELEPLRRFLKDINAASDAIEKGQWKGNADVEFVAFNYFSEVRPTSLASMPKFYLDHPTGRIVYNLRTFGVHQLDLIRQETWKKFQKGDHIGGLKGLAGLAGGLVIAGASIDEAIDFAYGRYIPFKTSVINNMMKIGMANDFAIKELSQGQFVSLASDYTLNTPLFSFLEKLYHAGKKTKDNIQTDQPWYTDLGKEPLVSNLPIPPGVGRLYYWRFSDAGKERQFKYFQNEYSDAVDQLTDRYNQIERVEKDRRTASVEAERMSLGDFVYIKTAAETLMKEYIEAGDLSSSADLVAHLNEVAKLPDSWGDERYFFEKQLQYYRKLKKS